MKVTFEIFPNISNIFEHVPRRFLSWFQFRQIDGCGRLGECAMPGVLAAVEQAMYADLEPVFRRFLSGKIDENVRPFWDIKVWEIGQYRRMKMNFYVNWPILKIFM